MCYSAQVIQMARKLNRQLGIRLDYDDIEKLFFRRLDDPSLLISRGFEANFDYPATDQERRIKGAIDEHRSWVGAKMEKTRRPGKISASLRPRSKLSQQDSPAYEVQNQTKRTTEFFLLVTPESSLRSMARTCSRRCGTTAGLPVAPSFTIGNSRVSTTRGATI